MKPIFRIKFDTRGSGKIRGNVKHSVPYFINQYLEDHPIVAKEFIVCPVDNQDADIIIEKIADDKTIAVFEMKLGKDLVNSFNNKRLKRELEETYLPLLPKFPDATFAVIAGGKYEPLIYSRLIGLSNAYPNFHFHAPLSYEAAIEKVFTIARYPQMQKTEAIPVLLHTGDKGFALAFSALINGVTEPLGHHLALNWTHNATEQDILEWVDDYYSDGRTRKKLAAKIYNAVNTTFLRKSIGELYND